MDEEKITKATGINIYKQINQIDSSFFDNVIVTQLKEDGELNPHLLRLNHFVTYSTNTKYSIDEKIDDEEILTKEWQNGSNILIVPYGKRYSNNGEK